MSENSMWGRVIQPSGSQPIIILIKFLISHKILISCRELYFEVVAHVCLITLDNFLGNELISVKDHLQSDTCLL